MSVSVSACLKAIRALCIWGVILCGVTLGPALADPANVNVLLIMDGSGSMWGRLENDPKIVIAKEQMTLLVQELEKVELGLIIYGHRRKSDCEDIELAVPLGKGDKTALIKQIQSVNPKGRTPITKAMQLAMAQLENMGQETQIVLVSDGTETCGGDPCTFIRNLKETGNNFKTDVIGFAVSDDDRTQLACIAQAGGGRYFNAQSAAQLKHAFAEVKKEILKQAAATPGLKLNAILKKGAPPITKDLYWRVYEARKDSNGERKQISSSVNGTPLFELPTGRYYITVEHGQVLTGREVAVTAGEFKRVVLNLKAGYLQFNAVLKAGAKPISEDLHWQVFAAQVDQNGSRKHIKNAGDAGPVFKLPSGRYYITAKHGQALAAKTVAVTAGKRKAVTLNLKAGYLQFKAVLQKGAEPVTEDLYWQVFKAQKDQHGKRELISTSDATTPIFKLSSGRYYVTADHGDARAGMAVSVGAGDRKDLTLNLDAGYLQFDAVLQNGAEPVTEDLYWQVFKAQKDQNGKRLHITNSGSTTPIFKLSAGRYHVTAEHGDAKASASAQVTAGELQTATLNLNAGYLRLKAVPKDGAKPLEKDIYWRIYEDKKDQSGQRKQIANSIKASPLLKLVAGRYYVTATHGKDQASVIVELTAGQRKKLFLNLAILE